jgi:hypothetical protein
MAVTTFNTKSAASPAMIAADNFGEISGLYIGTCEALNSFMNLEADNCI